MDAQSQEILSRELRRTCHEVAAIKNLSADQEEELFAHMEDKAFAYSSGDEKLSAKDIVLLVREHFGNPSALAFLHAGSGASGFSAFFHALTRATAANPTTDLAGMFHFPWYGRNLVFFPILIFLVLDVVTGTLVILRARGHGIAVVAPILTGAVAVIVPLVVFSIYRIVASKLNAKRGLLRSFALLDTEGILVHGVTESPAIIQSGDDRLVITPLLGEQLDIRFSDIQRVNERKFYNGTYYFMRNGAFDFKVTGRPERIGIIVPWPEQWRKILPRPG